MGAALAILALLACGPGKSEFQRNAGDAGAEMAAAARTLEALHQGRLTRQFARASFVNYREQLADIDSQLTSAEPHSDRAELQRLLALYRSAKPAIEDPCLEDDCDWRGQVKALDEASKAFVQAGG